MHHVFIKRENDWRMGGIVYQVFVDRFARSKAPLDPSLYPHPKRLLPWEVQPTRGVKLKELPYYSHELDFWGGNLKGLIENFHYLKNMGVRTIYLTPIFQAMSNHKYDTMDYEMIAPEFGTKDDLIALIQLAQHHEIAIVLDGVFNHISSCSDRFIDAKNNEDSPYRSWFDFASSYRYGYRMWHHAASLPELQLHHDNVRDYLLQEVVQAYLKLGIKGWRLDTGIELGHTFLNHLNLAAKTINPHALVIGEISNYPSEWTKLIDATIQFPIRDLIIQTTLGHIPPSLASAQLEQYILDNGMDAMLMSWVLLENHDLPRLQSTLPIWDDYVFAKWLSVVIPGNLHLYQGEELGLLGEGDPYNRQPFPWQDVKVLSPHQKLHQHMLRLRQDERALRIGDYKRVQTKDLISFLRLTEKVEETLLIVANPSTRLITEWLLIPDSKLRGHLTFYDLITEKKMVTSWGIYVPITIKPKQVMILKAKPEVVDGYDPYKYYTNPSLDT
jgi:glycosidase